jgi:CO/xanthine dehydrogenase Mo-binding subunit
LASPLRDKLKAAAAARFGCAADDVKLADGKATGQGGKSAAWSELGSNGAPPFAEAIFSNYKHTYAYCAGAAHVTVDPRACEVGCLTF